MRRMLAVLLAAGLLAGTAQAGEAGTTSPLAEPDTERLRRAGEQAWQELMESARVLGQHLQEVGDEMQRLMARTQTQMAREMAPAMRQLAERLNEMARELEQSPAQKEGT